MSLLNRTILMAGGTGGLGSATAELLLSEGARLVMSYRSNSSRAEVWKERAMVLQADLQSAADRQRLLDATGELYGLVVFAGDPVRTGSPHETLTHGFEVNCAGPLLLAREAAERMKEKGIAGAIVLFGTMQAVALFPGSTAYSAGKAALVHGAQILAKECRGPANVRVNTICPGVMQAGMASASIASGKYDRYITDGTISRFGRAEDIARTVRFLLEPDNYVTGQVLTIDGGLTL